MKKNGREDKQESLFKNTAKTLNGMNLHENNSIRELPSLILILGKPTNNEYVDKRGFVGPLASKAGQQQHRLLQST